MTDTKEKLFICIKRDHPQCKKDACPCYYMHEFDVENCNHFCRFIAEKTICAKHRPKHWNRRQSEILIQLRNVKNTLDNCYFFTWKKIALIMSEYCGNYKSAQDCVDKYEKETKSLHINNSIGEFK